MDKANIPSPDAAEAAGHPPPNHGRIGVLLVNLGTPDGTGYWPMRRYLKEFLSDRRVIETPRLLWWPILNGIILQKRPQKSGRAYRSIWNEERDESPLRTITRSQSDLLAGALEAADAPIIVDWAMRYGTPAISGGLKRLAAQGCDRVLVVPLYPQYSAATTATVNDKAFEALMRMRRQPALRTAPEWPGDPVYIAALADSIRGHLATLDFTPEVILASFHGLPLEYAEKGDPYPIHCQETGRLLREALGMNSEQLIVTFQSRFGKAEWLQPYTDQTVKRLAESGVRNLAVVTPGFVADCVETLEEIAVENAEIFHAHGGEHFTAVPCLNDSPEGMRVLEHVVRRELKGWI